MTHSKLIRNFLIFSFLKTTLLVGQEHADCNTAYEVCGGRPIFCNGGSGIGAAKMEALSCEYFDASYHGFQNYHQGEKNSVWMKFEIQTAGTLTFEITPDEPSDDLDFILFSLPADGNCDEKKRERCMFAGDNPNNFGKSNCLGPTGLKEGETDVWSDSGCEDPKTNTWLRPVEAVKDEKFVLLVNNQTRRGGGFTIEFGGSARLKCKQTND